ncbi:MAG TPA: serine/threonine-protein kinase, partial [Gemmataceae bacterium]|nr:serine/threonine-protein kinase [Gemmataceae bacterium]
MSAPRTAAAGAGLVEHLAEEMARRWQQGDRAPAEEYLARHPELWGQPEAALELVYEEIQLRQEGGEEVSAAALLRRFPQWHRELEAMLGCHRLLAGPAAALPEVGEVLGDFRLLAELGRGAHGRVFLAAQAALAGRPVVLKLSPLEGREHLSLARLQHTHIVPLHSVHDFPGRGLRALCMPYFGGATLDRVLAALACRPPAERIAADIARALSECGARKAEGGMADNAAFRLPHSAYVEVVCWVGACLAEALHYAHERGLVHLDVKPSNVLLAADGTPMLLDFHLARAPLAAGARAPGTLGGTPGYMAPEHRAALAAACERRPAPEAVDGRADVYALGLLLYEALAGRLPAPGEAPAPALRRLNPRVSPGLVDLLARCLAPLPAQRYASAAEVAADLRRHLADLPLRGVRNRSGAERWRKWRRRRPHALAALALALTAAAAGGLALAHFGRQAERARTALAQGEGHLGAGRFDQAGDAFRHGAALADDLPWGGGLAARLRGGLRRAERGLAAAELHAFSERV